MKFIHLPRPGTPYQRSVKFTMNKTTWRIGSKLYITNLIISIKILQCGRHSGWNNARGISARKCHTKIWKILIAQKGGSKMVTSTAHHLTISKEAAVLIHLIHSSNKMRLKDWKTSSFKQGIAFKSRKSVFNNKSLIHLLTILIKMILTRKS